MIRERCLSLPISKKESESFLKIEKQTLYICGHIHNFQHIKPEGKSVNYVVNASACEARKVNNTNGTLFCKADKGFTLWSVTKKSFTFYFINNKGETVHNYSLTK